MVILKKAGCNIKNKNNDAETMKGTAA